MPTVDWESRIINVPLSDLTLISTGVYQHDIDVFRLALKDLEDGEGMPYPDTHRHNTAVTISGITIARVFEIINGYTITYEDGQYRVVLVGANNNIIEVANVNQVSIVPTNSAGLIQVNTSGGTFTATDRTTLQSANTQATTAATNTATMLTRWTDALATALAKMGRRIGIGGTARHTTTSITTDSESYTITQNGENDYSVSEDE